jgi:hypothetical protein
MDFVSDSLADGRSFRALAIVDHYTRECPVIEIDLSLRSTSLESGHYSARGQESGRVPSGISVRLRRNRQSNDQGTK